jgi:hypothetical protein
MHSRRVITAWLLLAHAVSSVVAELRQRSRRVGTLEEEKRRVRALWRGGPLD